MAQKDALVSGTNSAYALAAEVEPVHNSAFTLEGWVEGVAGAVAALLCQCCQQAGWHPPFSTLMACGLEARGTRTARQSSSSSLSTGDGPGSIQSMRFPLAVRGLGAGGTHTARQSSSNLSVGDGSNTGMMGILANAGLAHLLPNFDAQEVRLCALVCPAPLLNNFTTSARTLSFLFLWTQ
eukprot:scaffold199546_cov21-Tisochrysis_lutea.AAC.1